MDDSALEQLGLTKGEVKVYRALIRLGEATIGPVGSESKVSKSKLYDILGRLAQKGLVSHVTRDGVQHFIANDPRVLLDYLAKQQEQLAETEKSVTEMLPRLIAERDAAQHPRLAEIHEGFRGVRNIREELMLTLSVGKELLVLGAPKVANERWEGWFLDFHKRRIERKVAMRIIYNADAVAFGAIRSRMALTKVRYLPNNLVSPNWIDIFPEAVLFVMVLETPLAFVVRNKALAESFRAYFELMWGISVEQIT
jgi:HTH-type transcriptional regulator, sugar sensing transcriptional regulator